MEGKLIENTLELKWNDCRDTTCLQATRFSLTIEKCEERLDCYTVKTQNNVEQNYVSITEKIFSQCTLYNVRLDAISNNSQSILSDELIVKKLGGECKSVEQIILTIGFSVLGILLVGAALAAYFYHKNHPIRRSVTWSHPGSPLNKKLQRVKSRVYCRLVSQDQYKYPINRLNFITTVDSIINQPKHLHRWEPDVGSSSKDDFEEEEKLETRGLEEEKLEGNKPFAEEFSRLERLTADTIQRRTTVAELPNNTRRNRYNDIVPFDARRVLISPPYSIPGDLHPSDYINASFISDVNTGQQLQNRRYIAAQGPGKETTPGFWQMIWQNDIHVIVMLTNLVEGANNQHVKCHMYWPDQLGDRVTHANITIQLFDVAQAPSYTVRKFDVTNNSGEEKGVNRVVVQIQFTNWKDRYALAGPSELLQLVQLSRVMYNQYSSKGSTAPLLVHCSAGVGRTGTFICVDQLMRAVDDLSNTHLDVFWTVYQLRRDRRYMVQSRAQYEYVYKCVAAYIALKQTKTQLQ